MGQSGPQLRTPLYVNGRVLLMDGALGSELYQAGLDPGECGAAWNVTRPERVRAIHVRHEPARDKTAAQR